MTFRRALIAACALLASALCLPGGATAPATAQAAAPEGNGMWIWYVSRSHGGDLNAIATRAKLSGISTLFVKSGDAGRYWTQFSPALVEAMHAQGIQVCAWQFVYGSLPYAEASVGAQAVANGADCLVIDAEGHYEGRYAEADQYMRSLRAAVGPEYPIGLAAFPYVHYHSSFPYSVFMGPGMAQYNLPQMYWKTIGTSVKRVFTTTFTYNRVYERPILPLGQTYLNPKLKQLLRFRRYAKALGSPGVSWWSWQETSRREWKSLRKRARRARRRPYVSFPVLRVGSRGDLVVWAQQHLAAVAGELGLDAPVGGLYGTRTADNVRAFQQSRGLPVTGVIDAVTWPALLQVTPVYVAWGDGSHSSARAGGPDSSLLPARAYEIPGQGVGR